MKYIESPEEWDECDRPAVFLAGGITGCPDWQKELTAMLTGTDYVVLNPRRENFPIGNPRAAEDQITWEFLHLRRASVVSFWFCKESVQPIALFELGAWSRGKDPAVIVGVEPSYPREQDVRIQMGLLGRKVLSSLEEVANELKHIYPSVAYRLRRKDALEHIASLAEMGERYPTCGNFRRIVNIAREALEAK